MHTEASAARLPVVAFPLVPGDPDRSSMFATTLRSATLFALMFVGCSSSHDTVATHSYIHPNDLPGVWTVTAIGTDRGRLTYDDVNHDHVYVLGIECKRGAQSMALLYYNQLPDDLVISVGDQLVVNPTGDTSFESMFGGGFWIRDLAIASP